MDAVQLAYLEVALARAVMRAHMDIEAQVAHWLLEGRARPQDLAEARKRLRDAKQAHSRAKAAYAALSTQQYARRTNAAVGVNGGGRHGGAHQAA